MSNPNAKTGITEAHGLPGDGEGAAYVGEYRVLREIGEGGMGVVLACFDEALEREVAVKQLRPEVVAEPGMVQRFLREARAQAALSSPHIVTVHHVGTHGDTPFLVMELLEGEDLARRIASEGPLPLRGCVSYTRDAVAGLAAAAATGLVHRDVKPANLFLVRGRVKLTDFGLARPIDGSANLTQAGVVVGTPYYLAPELVRGESATTAADVYALGATLFEMITGHPPYQEATAAAIMVAHITEPVPDPAAGRPGLPPALGALVMRMMAKQPQQRPTDLAALDLELEEIGAQLQPDEPGTAAEQHQVQPTAVVSARADVEEERATAPTAMYSAGERAAETRAQLADRLASLSGELSARLRPLTSRLPRWLGGGHPGAAVAVGLAALAVVGVVLLALAQLGDDALERIDRGEARAVLAELDEVPRPERTAAHELLRGHALAALERSDDALEAYRRALEGGEADARALDFALAALDERSPTAALKVLKRWPKGAVDRRLRELAQRGAWWPRHHAVDLLEDRGAEVSSLLAQIGLRDLEEGEDCQRRRNGLLLLKRYGASEAALEAVQRSGRRLPENFCLALDVNSTASAIRRRLEE